jgi:pimeloyl-ACP methyl ester carboxylesterase
MKQSLQCTLICILLLAGRCWGADPLDTWTWRNPLPTGNGLRSVFYANGRFLAGGDRGTILISPDGINWSSSNSGTNLSIYGYAYGGNQFVAVGGGGLILTSADSTNWITRDCGISDYFKDFTSVTYGNGLFVGVTAYLGGVTLHDGNIVTSVDGVNWTPHTYQTGNGNYLYGVSYGNGRFVAAGGDFNANSIVLTSDDGATWIQQHSGINPSGEFFGITYGNGMFVMVGLCRTNGDYRGAVLTSSDGVNWVQRYDGASGKYLRSVCYGNGLFIAAGDGNTLITSPDGINWTAGSAGSGNSFAGIAYGGGRYVLVGANSQGLAAILTSQDGISWTTRTSGTLNKLQGIGYASGQFMVTGSGTNLVSLDGAMWTGGNSRVTGTADFTYGAGLFLAATPGAFFTSTDWLSWTQRSWSITPGGVAFGNGQFIALSSSGYLISTNGTNWVSRSFPTNGNPSGIAFGNGNFVAFALGGSFITTGWVFVSQDGTNWSQHSLAVTNGMFSRRVAFGNGRFVAVGGDDNNSGTIVTSLNGTSWQQVGSGATFNDICYGSGHFVAVGSYGTIFSSTDGLSWSKQNSSTGASLRRVAYGNGHFVTIGDLGTILQSGDVAPHAPTVTSPQSQTVQVGSNVNFAVIASGIPPLNYEWQFNGQNIAGQTASNLFLANVQFTNAGGYSVVVTNTYGSVTSAVAQLTVFTNLFVAQTNKAPPPPGSATILTDATHFKVFTNGGFVTGIGLNPSKSTIVLTHGWNDRSSGWPLEMANNIKLVLGSSTPNIVAWDWTTVAAEPLTSAADQTLGQGYALGTDLVAALGINYSKRIHFVGHSLGTMVNAKAANVAQSLGFNWTNTQMTLFDEASVASGLLADSWQTATTLLQNDVNPQLTLQPVLPAQFAWADNYITAFGLIHSNAVNVILTNSYPVINNGVIGDIENVIWKNFVTEDTIYHNYSHDWYFNTVNQINNPNDPPYLMGFVRSWEGGGTVGRPATNTYYIESANCPPSFLTYSGYDPAYNLVQITSDQASQFLNNRLNTILPQLALNLVSTSQNVLANAPNQVQAMLASGQILDPAADEEFLLQYGAATIVQFGTAQLAGSLVVKGAVQPQGGPVPNGTGVNSPAYVWITLSVPSNAVAMSFDFILQGNGNQDSFQAALNNQNIFTLETVLIQTNVGMNSGMIDVSQYAGQQVQLFLGIVGGTSTNATATVGNILFYSAAPPPLQIQMSGTNVVLTWPLWAATYSLETTATLGMTNSWTVVTNAPLIVNSKCTITNKISNSSVFYRLAIVTAPTLQAQISGKNIILSWPTSAQSFSLQTTTNLANPNSWMTLTNVAAIVNLQKTITNPIIGSQGFYRLIQSQ